MTHSRFFTPEVKEKLRRSHLGKKLSPSTREKLRLLGEARRGVPRTEEHKKRMREGCAKRSNVPYQGPNSGKWKGGDVSYFKRQAKKRDNFTCQVCGLYDPIIMEVDHIKSSSLFPELRKELSNLRTICPNCHVRKTKQDKLRKFPTRRHPLESFLFFPHFKGETIKSLIKV